MDTTRLPVVGKSDDLLVLIEQFKIGLTIRATGGLYDDSEYQKVRKLILSNPNLDKLTPKFLRICRTVDEYWRWIKVEIGNYEGRRSFIAEQLNPLLEAIEYENGEGALEFSRNYEEKELIGNGGFGIVYKYEHRLLKLPFAVKIFAPAFYEAGSNEKELERFFQEARILFKLSHPNIIKVYDAGMLGKRPFIRMEYFDGRNLNQLLQAYGILNEPQAQTVIVNIVAGIQHAHDQGVIHRDLKPSNVMASKPNQFRVIDFGLGVLVENNLYSRLTVTGTQTISGYYNAPELVADPKLIDKRSDIYSIGAIWFTLLTGQPPAGTNFLSSLKAVGTSEGTIDLISRCLNPLDTRFLNCQEILNGIENRQ